jgi:hypothetical protein
MKNFLVSFGKLLVFFAITIPIARILPDYEKPFFALFNTSDESFALAHRSDVAKCRNNDDCYLMPKQEHGKKKGAHEGDYSAYDVIEKTENYSVVQTTFKDGYYTAWTTYSIDNNNEITSITSRHVLGTVRMAFSFVLLVVAAGFIIQFFVKRKPSP